MIREATASDIKQMQHIRNAVKENPLSDASLISYEDYLQFISTRGKGWVKEIEGKVVGFSIVDLKENNVWALFIDPLYEKRSIGRQLHDCMLDWYFNTTKQTLWLGTSPHTRAETFYRAAGWKEAGVHGKGEIKFEMTFYDWIDGNRKGR